MGRFTRYSGSYCVEGLTLKGLLDSDIDDGDYCISSSAGIMG